MIAVAPLLKYSATVPVPGRTATALRFKEFRMRLRPPGLLLSLLLSMDNGRSWPVLRTSESGPGGCSDLAVLPTMMCSALSNRMNPLPAFAFRCTG